MARRFEESTLVIASHNEGKVREIADLLAPFSMRVASVANFGLDEPEETGNTFQENAEIKARYAAMATGLPALADDSGLSVEALDGEPGIFSARWAGPERDFSAAMKKVNEALGDEKNRRAAFICALTLAWPDGTVKTFEGRVEGDIVWPPRGDKGFGYDPIFQPSGYEQTFGEMQSAEKHAISHRARAFQQLVEFAFK